MSRPLILLAEMFLNPKRRPYWLLLFIGLLVIGVSLSCAALWAGASQPLTTSILPGIGSILCVMSVWMLGASTFQSIARSQQVTLVETKSYYAFVWQTLTFERLSEEHFSACFAVHRFDTVDEGNITCASAVVEEITSPPLAQEVGSRDSEYPTVCGICLEQFEPISDVVLLPCRHVYCEQCIMSWVSSRSSHAHRCPHCRRSFALEDTLVLV
eukprot:gnl/TRDRNA2_/TRDRNA2_165981_c0_seq1.p1 gnl/TRDRNA2_/TRDRNA2_165981_c0~~gnl/TRDRNA2_/TRDRNA2_165981_c0_seq1.p1  ORF type:complete len:213 (+),score=11.83 gnl/TRDRNA2_/TRDRNA2_165981_c0_seq1:58-696(+)